MSELVLVDVGVQCTDFGETNKQTKENTVQLHILDKKETCNIQPKKYLIDIM